MRWGETDPPANDPGPANPASGGSRPTIPPSQDRGPTDLGPTDRRRTDLGSTVDVLVEDLSADLERLTRVPSVAFPRCPPEPVTAGDTGRGFEAAVGGPEDAAACRRTA